MNQEILRRRGRFTWLWSCDWFVETEEGNFHWSDPDYPEGDNTLTRYDGNLKSFLKKMGVRVGRDKGFHVIGDYCGTEVKVVDK